MPSFLGLSQKRFDPATYEAPSKGHGAETANADFSAFSTASTTLYWRRDPKDPQKLQSTSRIIRWSDGSLTLQLAYSPKDQYKISTQALRQSFGKNSQKPSTQTGYDPSKDAQFYLAAEHAQVPAVHQIVAPLDAALKILPTGDQADESVLKLQQSLAAASNVHDPLTALKQVKEDPELAKKAAEMFEKDRLRSTRRRELAEEKLLTRKDRVLGRSGLGRSGGLSVAGLEDEDGMPTARGSKGLSKKKGRRRINRHGEIYSDDEDEDMPRGRTREDEYDLDDDFMAASDEEPEIYDESGDEKEDDDPDVDDLEIEGRETVVQGKTRGGGREKEREKERNQGRDRDRNRVREKTISRSRAVTPKRALDEESGDMAGTGSPQARKKRRVIDDDDDDEE
jgi:RNA polymerase-associated protein LEO1